MLPISRTRFLTMWLTLGIAMTANGIFREVVLKRAMSSWWADLLSVVIGILLIAVITRVAFRSATASTAQSLASASFMLVLLTVVFETALGVFVDHESIGQLVGHYAIWRGELWPIVLGFLAFTPYLWARSPRAA